MLETSNESDNLAYPDFLKNIITLLQLQGRKPFFLIHEANDLALANSILAQIPNKIPVYTESNPLIVKGIIGKSHAVITSRFHGLVSALCQNVPCLATGWSHKYEMLLKDYGYAEGLCGLGEPESYYLEKLDLILHPELRKKSIQNLVQKAKEQKELSRKMWKRVFEVISN